MFKNEILNEIVALRPIQFSKKENGGYVGKNNT